MLSAADFRSEKGRANLTVKQISTGTGVSTNTIVKLIDDKKSATVTLGKARAVMGYLKGYI